MCARVSARDSLFLSLTTLSETLFLSVSFASNRELLMAVLHSLYTSSFTNGVHNERGYRMGDCNEIFWGLAEAASKRALSICIIGDCGRFGVSLPVPHAPLYLDEEEHVPSSLESPPGLLMGTRMEPVTHSSVIPSPAIPDPP